ncbi:pyrroloquinoline quinone precursor peptide PqqA [Streptomyces sp. V2]|nr:pyrroloquinoline quinone precursor peptide PqqA [Streptomyces sp. V2]PWG13479.1 pyrroloquinoline quinone precursor peptide PqqA [Streptomyces sp. V2]
MIQHDERDDRTVDRPDEKTDQAAWHRPTYQIVEASMEMSAYFLSDR